MNKSNDISNLIRRCQKFDRKAQRELYLRFADLLMNTAIRYAKDFPHAEDLVHDTFLKAFNNISKYKDQGKSFEVWIKKILINEALQAFRINKKIETIEINTLMETPSSEWNILDALKAEDILKLLQKLPEGCKMVFNLYVIEGYKHEEIGQLLGITASASRAQLTRAKKTMRALIENINSFITE